MEYLFGLALGFSLGTGGTISFVRLFDKSRLDDEIIGGMTNRDALELIVSVDLIADKISPSVVGLLSSGIDIPGIGVNPRDVANVISSVAALIDKAAEEADQILEATTQQKVDAFRIAYDPLSSVAKSSHLGFKRSLPQIFPQK